MKNLSNAQLETTYGVLYIVVYVYHHGPHMLTKE